MNTVSARSLCTGILALSLLSSIALADPAEDMALGEAAFNREDLIAAMEHFTKAAEQNFAPAQVRIGEILDASEFDKEAADWYRKAAEQGNSSGEYYLGHMYVTGEGVEKNFEKALYWYNLAARKDNLLALKTLASAYQKGELGLTIDLDRAKLFDAKVKALETAARKAEAKKAKKGAGK